MDNNPKLKNRLISFSELVFIGIITFIALLLINADILIRAFFNRNSVPIDYLSQELTNIETYVPDAVYDLLFSPSVATFILWSVIGLIVYLVYLSFQAEAGSFFSKIKISFQYVHPRQFNQLSFWGKAILELLFPIVTLTSLLAWTWLCFTIMVPYSSMQLLIALFGYSSTFDTLLSLIYSFVSLGLVGVGYLVIFRTFAALWPRIT